MLNRPALLANKEIGAKGFRRAARNYCELKGLVHPKIKIPLSFTHPHVIPGVIIVN